MQKSTNSTPVDNSNPKQHPEVTAQSFKEEFSQLNEDMGIILHHLKESGATLAKDVSHDLMARAETITSRLASLNNRLSSTAIDFMKHQASRTREKTQEYSAELESTIKEHPLSSIMISFGIGVVISRVFDSWHSSR